MFGKKPNKLQVVEVEMPRKAPYFSEEIKESLASLAGHPGFLYLLDRLKFERAVLKTKLCNERHDNLRDIEFLQSGVYWTNWLQAQLDKATNRPAPRSIESLPEEMAALDSLPPLPDTVEVIGG